MKAALIVFTRLPEAGTTKTRLIPAVGPGGAAEWQRRLTLHHVGRAASFVMAHPGTELILAHAGGTRREMREWLGPWRCEAQGSGDLGSRLHAAITSAHRRGAEKILVTGSDCPGLDESHFATALARLDSADLVIGPATDGGYTLIGLRCPEPRLFDAMPWGGPDVLATTLARAREIGWTIHPLEPLPDVDEPADLPAAEATLAAARRVSVIVPARNEPAALAMLLPHLLAGDPHEILIADGGGAVVPAEFTADPRVTVLPCPPGRARQMNAAAARATGEHLLFLHADTFPPPGYASLVADPLARPGVAGGAFRFGLCESFAGKALVESLTRLRGRLFHTPYGDQGLFVRRRLFEAIGGFPEMPILEDLEMVLRLRRLGDLVITRETAATSARRWREHGLFGTWLRHQRILLGHRLGIAPERLATWR